MIPGWCRFEADIRSSVGLTRGRVLKVVGEALARYHEVTMREIGGTEPSWCDPDGEMVQIIQRNVEQLRGFRPVPTISLGGTDARLLAPCEYSRLCIWAVPARHGIAR
jgi:succinyl-diaminopimelate desuccinylase